MTNELSYDTRLKRFVFSTDRTNITELRRLGATELGGTSTLVICSLPALCCTISQLERSFGTLTFDPSMEPFLKPWGFPFKNTRPFVVPGHLYKYQMDAVQFLVDSPHHGSILALSPGLGKTLTAITAADVSKAQRILVVCPLSLIPTWKAEIYKWSGRDAEDCHRSVPAAFNLGWHITNYETVVTRRDAFRNLKFDLIIVDESIMVKNRNSLRSRAIQMLSRNTKKIWLLSGSPVSKYADDLYMQLNIIEPGTFRSYWRFAGTYCFIEKTIWGDKVSGTRPNIDFRKEFKDLMFVRSQKEVLSELPDLLHENYDLEMGPDQSRMYKAMAKDFTVQLEDGTLTAATKLTQLIRLQQIVSCPETIVAGTSSCKMEMIQTLIKTETLPMPAIIWVNFKATADNLYAMLKESHPELRTAKVTGDDAERGPVFESFQKGELDILILSLGVGKFGLTLTTAQSAVYYDRTFDGDAYVQSMARIHRIGLDHSPVVITLRVPKTTDELIEMNLSGKLRSIHAISNNDLATLMKGLSK